VSITSNAQSDLENFQRVLSTVVQEDPTLKISTLSAGGHAIIRGMSESHLETACDQISRELQIELDIGDPKVICVETIRRSSDAEGKYIRQTGGSGNYGHVKLRLEPGEPGSGYQFSSEIREGQIPPEFIEPVSRGVLEAANHGILARPRDG
jgi:elongation factor G